MRVLLVNQYFWPDMAATAQLLADLAEDLAAAGHEVTALAGRGSYAPGRPGKPPRRERWRGVDIHRVFATDLGRASALRRLADYASYFVSAALAVATRRPRPEAVVCLSTPPLVATLGLLARRRGARFVYKVEDLYPDLAIALGGLRPRTPVTAGLGRLSRRLLSAADAVVALDEGMARVLAERGARRVEVIPNWADGEAIRPDPATGDAFRREHALENRLVVLYSGNLGLAHRFDAVVDAARALEPELPEALFLFVGGGPRLEEVERRAAGLDNVRFLPYQPRDRLGALYNGADLHLVTLRNEVKNLLVPSKYAAALATGKPVLLVGGTGTAMADEIRNRGLGWAIAHDPQAVADAVRAARDPAAREASGRAARRTFDALYARRTATTAWQRLLESLTTDER